MSLWDKIRDKILPNRNKNQTTMEDLRNSGMLDGPNVGAAGGGTATASQAQPGQQTDVAQVLESKLAEKGNPDLNWRSSIVDLMKLIDVDSSLDNRKELATELGYSGDKDGSAEMNIWLHKAVMKKLAENGGKVPAGLAD